MFRALTLGPKAVARPGLGLTRNFGTSAPRFAAGGVRRPGVIRRTIRFAYWTTVTGIFAGLGYVGVTLYATRFPPPQLPIDKTKKNLVILGSGWGSISLLKSIDTSLYNVTVVSPRNYFLFTPLLPSCSTGMVEHRSIMEPIRAIMRLKQAESTFVEGEATHIDTDNKKISVKGKVASTTLDYDMLVIGVGSEVSTYGIPGVQEHGIFMKEIDDAQKARQRIMDCVEAASFPGQSEEARRKLLHAVVVGGGPTGVEFAGELHDFFEQDLRKFNPAIADYFKVTLVEALPNVLPSFSKHLIAYTERTLKDEDIDVLTKTAVKEVTADCIVAEQSKPDGSKERVELPYGIFVWAGGNKVRSVVAELIAGIPAQANSRRGLLIDEYLAVNGTDDVWALGDCTSSHYAPTAQVAAQQGTYLGKLFNHIAKVDEIDHQIEALQTADDSVSPEVRALERQRRRNSDFKTFQYSHQGSLAYVGSDKAVADLPIWGDNEVATSGSLTFWFWRSAYISLSFSVRNKILVAFDWMKVQIFGRDVSRE